MLSSLATAAECRFAHTVEMVILAGHVQVQLKHAKARNACQEPLHHIACRVLKDARGVKIWVRQET
jgi:hypothetical protein